MESALVAISGFVSSLLSFFWVNFPPFPWLHAHLILILIKLLNSSPPQWIRVVAAQVSWHRGGGSLVEGRQERRDCEIGVGEIVACEIGVGEILR